MVSLELEWAHADSLDSFGHIYVIDALFDNVQIFDDQGRLLLNWGEAGSDPGQFWLPAGVFVTEGGLVFVADAFNRRVQIFRYLESEG